MEECEECGETKQEKQWVKLAKKKVSEKFWPWETVEKFRKLRAKYLKDRKRTYKGEELLPPELLSYINSMKAEISPFAIRRKKENSKIGEAEWQTEVKYSKMALSSGHYGIIFDYSEIQKTPSVIKLQRFENVKRPLDIYSFVMEIIIVYLIQFRGLNCTPKLFDVQRTSFPGDPIAVFEKLSINLSEFFMNGEGSIDYEKGLMVLRDVAARIWILQKTFKFRHRDFRLKNVMIKDKNDLSEGCCKIIDMGKASIVFNGKEFSSYNGYLYSEITDDFDLGFFMADMLINFKRSSKCRNQLELYEDILSHFTQGIRYEHLVHAEKHLNKLMEQTHLRDSETRRYSQPYYVYHKINDELELFYDESE